MNWDVDVVWSTVNGAEKLCEVSIWIVYVAAPATLLQSKVIACPGLKRASLAGATSDGAGSVPDD